MSDGQQGAHFTVLDGDDAPTRLSCSSARSVLRRWHAFHCGCHIASVAVIIVLLTVLLRSRDQPTPAPPPTPRQNCTGTTPDSQLGVCGRRAMVSTSNEYATQAALEILQAGGNVVDAAAAAQLMLGLTQPLSTSIGGGCFVVVFNATTGQVSTLDAREEAPARYTPTTFCAQNSSVGPDGGCTQYIDYDQLYTGGMAVGVPGVPRALERMLQDNGTMTFAQVAGPTVRVARAGFRLSQFMYDQLLVHRDLLFRFAATRALYFDDDGNPKARPGELMYNPDYAALLELLAAKGIDEFYTGQVARDIVDAARGARNDLGLAGVLTMLDMASYAAVYRPPLRFKYRDFEVVGMGMPSSGPLTLSYILSVLETLDLGNGIVQGSVEYMHRVLDAEDLAFSDRNAWMADADFADVPLAGLLNKTYVRQRARRFLKATVAAGAPLPAGEPPGTSATQRPSTAPAREGTETSHLVVADATGNAVSMTTTIQTWWGSGVVVPSRGFLLNNELSDFNREPNTANSPSGERRRRRSALPPDDTTVGGKRPRSSMSPLIALRNGTPWVAVGASGGSTIIGGVLNALLPVLDYDSGAQEAVDSPRMLSRNDRVCIEPVLAANRTVMASLARLGFQFRSCDPDLLAVVQMVRLRHRADGAYTLYGAADRTRLASALAEGL